MPENSSWSRAFPYVLPFALFLTILGLRSYLHIPEVVLFAGWIAIVGGALAVFSRSVIDLRLRHALPTIAIGLAVFAIWIGPDLLFPGYRSHWLFQNGITGTLRPTITEAGRTDLLVILLRLVRAVLLVPIVEELFWRAFLMRWAIRPDFESVPLGTYDTRAFWLIAVLFATEHGPYWDVGLAAGAIYNWWIVRTRSLGDLIWAHAVTNACLCGYVLATGKWEYWM